MAFLRTVFHALLLGLLVAGVLYAIGMATGFLMMAAMAADNGGMMAELTPTQTGLGVVMLLMWGGVIAAGMTALIRQVGRSRSLARWVDAQAGPPSPDLAQAVADMEFTAPVREVPDAETYAFTHRVWRPEIVVSSRLVAQLSVDELAALLQHEASHVRNRDPLKVLAYRTWGSAFAFLPVVGAVFRRLLERQELRADRAAIRRLGTAPVAGALLKSVGRPAAAPGSAVAAMGSPDLLEQRISQLETGRVPGVLAAVPPALGSSLPGVALVATYGVLLYQVCSTVPMCCNW